ncbi:MAG TPA: polyprenyl synthetase family protein [Phototrophicaceae bacterium]|nr:polyprenyl synthetase family protein [Phototrophicaceae bacterium]
MLSQLAQPFLADIDATMYRVLLRIPNDVPGFGVMLRYALGWVDENDQPYRQSTGKRIRPLLLLLCAEAAGGDWHQALPAAAAVELLHNFSLIHDDIQDNSPTRHKRFTVWKIWGAANAINAGDALFSLAHCALEALAEGGVNPSAALRVSQIFNATTVELTRGQHLDMRFEHQAQVSVEEYLSMIVGKSAALVSACAEIGALIGSNGDRDVAAHYADFGLNLGLAFQIRDDILGIWGDPSVTGKSAATDILSRKKSLPVLYGLSQSAELAAVYQRENFTEADVTEAVAILDRIGVRIYTQEQETAYYQKAIEALQNACPQGQAANWLRQLVNMLFGRTY